MPRGLQPGVLRNEDLLLLCCIRPNMDEETRRQISSLLQRPLDANGLLRRAALHGLTPLLHSRLTAPGVAPVPDEINLPLASAFQRISLRNVQLTGELFHILSALSAASVPALAYKGPVLAAQAYSSLALREFSDLDLLIHESDLPAAESLVRQLDFRPVHRLTRSQRTAYLHATGQLPFFRPSDSVLVELHINLTPRNFPLRLVLNDLENRPFTFNISGRSVPTLPPDDQLLLLAVHGAKHSWAGLGWLADFAFLINSQADWNWPQVFDRARKHSAERMLSLALVLASDLCNSPLPGHIRESANSSLRIRRLAARVASRLFAEDLVPPSARTSWRFLLAANDSRARGALYCADLLLTPTVAEWSLLRLPRPLFPLYYLLRPLRLLAKYAAKAFSGSPSPRRPPSAGSEPCL